MIVVNNVKDHDHNIVCLVLFFTIIALTALGRAVSSEACCQWAILSVQLTRLVTLPYYLLGNDDNNHHTNVLDSPISVYVLFMLNGWVLGGGGTFRVFFNKQYACCLC